MADALVAAAANPDQERIAERLKAKSQYYDVARDLARLASRCGTDDEGKSQFVVCSGGGPSIMEAANRGAVDEGSQSIGLNIVLPHEQLPNRYVTPDLSFQFHYFALRKMHFLLRARAVAVFPGGYGTFDELFEILTLQQTHKAPAIPTVLVDEEYWRGAINFDWLVEHGMVGAQDFELFSFASDAEDAWRQLESRGVGRE